MANGIHIMEIKETKWSNTTLDVVSIKDFALERKGRNIYGGGVHCMCGIQLVIKLSIHYHNTHWSYSV